MTSSSLPSGLLIGATGPTGREILAKAASAGWRLRALARQPDALSDFTTWHEIVRGDVLNPASLESAVSGVDIVISVLGTGFTFKPVTLLSDGTRNIVAAMRKAGAGRLICITGMGAGDSRGHGGFLYDCVALPLLLRTIYADKDRQEAIVRQSGLDWVLVRPAMLTNGAATGRYRVLTDLTGKRLTKISRKDVADFVVAEATAPKYTRQAVNLSE